jgi:cysteine desulfurase/selenocysteine lyase
MPPRHYLDNAATSFPKPEVVYAAIDDYNRRLGASAGRGAYSSAVEAADVVRRCRLNLARLFHAGDPDRFAFTLNGTDALNLALHGLLRPGDHVVSTIVEHNSILRPLRSLAERGVTVTYVDCDERGRVAPDAVRSSLRPETKLVAVTHVSNVLGTIEPIADVAGIARAAGVLVLIDAAQAAGHLPIDLDQLPVDMLATSGHKGLLGPLGTGVLYVRDGLEDRLVPPRQGGTGTVSEDDRHPGTMPELFEAGNLNVAGIAGLAAATGWLLDRGVDEVRRHEQQLTARLLEGLRDIASVRLAGPESVEDRTGIVSLAVDGWDSQDLAAVLDVEFGVEARAGLHCAPRIHERLGSATTGGLLRLSVGAMTTTDDVDAVVAALRSVCSA